MYAMLRKMVVIGLVVGSAAALAQEAPVRVRGTIDRL